MPRNFMQEIVGKHWVPDAEQRTAGDELQEDQRPRNKGRRKKGLDKLCLHQLMTFAVSRRSER
jgi:hypothetical protein